MLLSWSSSARNVSRYVLRIEGFIPAARFAPIRSKTLFNSSKSSRLPPCQISIAKLRYRSMLVVVFELFPKRRENSRVKARSRAAIKSRLVGVDCSL